MIYLTIYVAARDKDEARENAQKVLAAAAMHVSVPVAAKPGIKEILERCNSELWAVEVEVCDGEDFAL